MQYTVHSIPHWTFGKVDYTVVDWDDTGWATSRRGLDGPSVTQAWICEQVQEHAIERQIIYHWRVAACTIRSWLIEIDIGD
jgi:hypothetical protein